MAYDDYSMGGYIPGDYETEEERRRRLAAEQAQYQAQDQESGGITAQRSSLGDLASQYLGRRVDAAQQRFTDATQMFTDPATALERRMSMTEQPDAANTEVQSQQVKTYADGSQEEIVKRQTPAPAPAPTPVAPTPMAPAPAAAPAPAPAPVAQAQQVAPVPQAQEQILPARSVSPEEQAQQEAMVRAVQQPQNVPQGGPPTQFAGTATAGAMNQPFTGQGIQMPAPGGVPSLAASGAQAQALEAQESQGQRYADQINNGNLYSLLSTDANAPRMVKVAAADKARDTLNQERIKADVETKVAGLTDPKDVLKIFDEFKRSKSEDGSYLRAYLLKRFGFDAAADDEMSKLGWGAKYEHMILDGGREAMIKYSIKGEPIAGIDAEGNKLGPKELVAAGAMKGAQTALSVGYDTAGNVISHRALPNGRGFIWKNETTGETLKNAPEGYHQGKNQQEMLALSAYKQSYSNDEAANRRAREKGERPQYSESQMQQRAQNQRNQILGLPTTTYGGAGGANRVEPASAETPPADNKKVASTGGANRVAATTATTGGGQGTGGAAGAPASGAAPSAREAKMSTAQQIANFSLAPVKDPVVMAEVQRLNPNWSEGKFKAANKVRENFATVNPASAGGQLQAVNRAIPHLEQYREAILALNNGNMPKVNSILQLYDYNVGDDKIAAAKAIQGLVSTEVMKAVAGGLGGVEERTDLKAQLGTNLNEKQLNRVINEYQGLMAEQARGLKQNWTSHGLPEAEFDQKLVPKAREVLNRPSGHGAPKTPPELAREEQQRRRKAQQ